MTIKEIQQQVDTFQDIITTSRAVINDGHFVEVSELEASASYLFSQIESQCGNFLNTEVDKLIVTIKTLLSDLDSLGKEIDNQHNSLITGTKVSSNTATAAYQS